MGPYCTYVALTCNSRARKANTAFSRPAGGLQAAFRRELSVNSAAVAFVRVGLPTDRTEVPKKLLSLFNNLLRSRTR